MSAEQAREKFDAGADLIQLITGMIFEGPSLIKKICSRSHLG
jgi:dihydroorotate dehydrogenase